MAEPLCPLRAVGRFLTAVRWSPDCAILLRHTIRVERRSAAGPMALTNPAVLSYHTLRRAVGIIALSLPFILTVGTILLALIGPAHALPRPVLQRSISDYYYTPMGNYLIGSLGAIAAFLICSRGYDLTDEIAGYFAGAFTLGVAFFPSVNPHSPHHSRLQLHIQAAHTAFAALMFLTLAYFCLYQFRKTAPGRTITRRKRHRNAIYRTCGIVIVICIIVMVSLNIPRLAYPLQPVDPLLCSESLALVAFGIAWLIKGEGLLRDKPQNHNHNHTNHATRIA